MFKKRKNIIIVVLIIVTIGVIGFSLVNNKIKIFGAPVQAEQIIKRSPYTLEELYEIIENPTKFNEYNQERKNDLAYTLFNFYDYFSKETPFMIAPLEEIDGKQKIKYIDYLSYEEYMKIMKPIYEEEKNYYEIHDEDELPFRYNVYISGIIYQTPIDNKSNEE